ncbi:Nucleosome assembly protein 1-like 1 [Myotis brandtii]|uniref:Nucleosome assembly protein 1-like 1 n=1 Tax=Myotis brandtii TaxID=109478 RepID=S7QCN5_MYOBR|nr:Nucleosome assembly protein 1-like 1 [Myotis brandtii]
MMQNPQILAALQERLDGLVETPTGYIESLPKVVKRRVNALKNLQVKCAQIEAKFYEEVHDLERKYAVLYQPLFDKRFEIINAIYEPTEEECEWKPDEEDDISEELKEKVKIEDEKKDEEKQDPKGIPEFWLTVFKNVDLLSDMVQEHDEPILKHLKDIKVKFSDAGQPMDDDAEAILAADFEIGHFLRERIIPRSVLYFTGEAIEDDDDDVSGSESCNKIIYPSSNSNHIPNPSRSLNPSLNPNPSRSPNSSIRIRIHTRIRTSTRISYRTRTNNRSRSRTATGFSAAPPTQPEGGSTRARRGFEDSRKWDESTFLLSSFGWKTSVPALHQTK